MSDSLKTIFKKDKEIDIKQGIRLFNDEDIQNIKNATPQGVKDFFEPTPNVRLRDVAREIPGNISSLLFPQRGFKKEEITQARPTLGEKTAAIPKFGAELTAGLVRLSDLLVDIPGINKIGDISALQKIAKTKPVGSLIEAKEATLEGLESFATPKTASEAKAMRILDAATLFIGEVRIGKPAAQSIAKSKNAKEISKILQNEIKGIKKEGADSLALIFKEIDNAEDVQKAVNRIDFAVNKFKGGKPKVNTKALERKAGFKEASKTSLEDFLPPEEVLRLENAYNNELTRLELSEAGRRLFKEDGVTGVASTFPKWVPQELRVKSLFDKFLENRKGDINEIQTLKYKEGSRLDKLNKAFLAQLDIPEQRKPRQMKTSREITSLEKTAEGQLGSIDTLGEPREIEDSIGQIQLQRSEIPKDLDSQKQVPLKEVFQKEKESLSLNRTVPQTYKLSKPDKKTSVQDSVYQSNRAKTKTSRIKSVTDSLRGNLQSIKETADVVLGPISTRLKNIDPSLKKSLRTFEFNLSKNSQVDRKAVEPFLKKLSKFEVGDYVDFDLALKNGDGAKIDELITKYDLEDEFSVVRTTLDDLWKRADEVGYDIGYLENYFPRTIKDPSGLVEFLQDTSDWSIIDDAIKFKENDLGRYLTVEEKANVINTLIRGYGNKTISLSETGAMKDRRIDLIDADANQFYRDSASSLLKYIDDTNRAVESRKFFGKSGVDDQFGNIDDSIGSYVLNLLAEGKIKPSQEIEIRDILQARFKQVGTNGAVRVYKNLSYIDTMGSVTSAITQIGDLAFALYKGGFTQTAKSLGKAVVKKSDITVEDIGVEKIAQEFEDPSKSAKAVDAVFQAVGLKWMDKLGKETLINSSVSKMRKQALNPTDKFVEKLNYIFPEEVVPQVIDDLKIGKVTDDIKLLAFNELADIQPIALSEMPQAYLTSGNGRIFYMLKTFTIKLFDVYRNEVFQQIQSGNKVQGIQNLVKLSAALLVMNATADEIKDFILGRNTSLGDRVVDNILKLMGFSKFTIYKAREEGIGSATARTILPPFKFIDAVYKDISKGTEINDLETIQSIPIGGKLYYWWFGKGVSKRKRQKGENLRKEFGIEGTITSDENIEKLKEMTEEQFNFYTREYKNYATSTMKIINRKLGEIKPKEKTDISSVFK